MPEPHIIEEERDALETRVTYPKIRTAKDVRAWFDDLLAYGVSFHPEESFENIVSRSGARVFSGEDAARMDAAMATAYTVCEDPCEIGAAAMRAHFDAVKGR